MAQSLLKKISYTTRNYSKVAGQTASYEDQYPVQAGQYNDVITFVNDHETRIQDIEDGSISFATHITDTTDTTSGTTGSLIVDGGIGIAKSLYTTLTTKSGGQILGGITTSGGTAGTPGIAVLADMGIYASSATELAFTTQGVFRGRISATAGLEVTAINASPIGTTTPSTGIFTRVDSGVSGAKISLTSATIRAFSGFTTSSIATATNLTSLTIDQTLTGASAVNTIEASQFIVNSAVQMGNWANAVLAKVDLKTTGYVTGLVGVVCAELDMPSTAPAGGAGTYSVYETEINMASAAGVPVVVNEVNIWGNNPTEFDTNGYLFDINGVTVGSGKFFQSNTAADATHALKIRIGGVPYYMMLTSVGA